MKEYKTQFKYSFLKFGDTFIRMNKIFLGVLVNLFITAFSYTSTSFLLKLDFDFYIFFAIVIPRIILPFILFNDYKLSWSKASVWTAYIKFFINSISFVIYSLFFYIFYKVDYSLLIFEYSNYLFLIAISLYTYRYYKLGLFINKENKIIIYGAGKAGVAVSKELSALDKVVFFIDDDKKLHYRSIDGISIVSSKRVLEMDKINLINSTLIIALPSVKNKKIVSIYNKFKILFKEIKILPPSSMTYTDRPYVQQLKKISILDLLARNPKDLDERKILEFIKGKTVLITGSSGTIGGELLKLCIKNNAKKIIAIDHNEFGQYELLEKSYKNVIVSVISILNKDILDNLFKKYKPNIVLHAAAYKHVHLSEYSYSSTIINNIKGTKNIVDLSIKYSISKFVLISTDKAVKPTNVMGATKSIAELYCQNVCSLSTDVVCVRFGNVLGSSGSVIPKFQNQIDLDQNITVTHKDITRYFMLVTEACNLVLQSASIGKNGEILILDMGNPIKISDLAKKMIGLSGKDYLKIKYTGLRKGEKLYEELLFDDSDKKTDYNSITVANKRTYDIDKLNYNIKLLLECDSKDKIRFIKKILPDFNHLRDNKSTLSKQELKELNLLN